MGKASRSGTPRAAVRRPKPRSAGGGLSDPDAFRAVSRIDAAAFAAFVLYLVLAFTTAIPEYFALPKVLGLYAYAAFCAIRWALALSRGRVRRLPRALALTAAALAGWWIVTTLTAQHVPTSLYGMRGRYNGLATQLAELALFFFIATTRITARDVEQRLGVVCVALTAASAYALLQAVGHDPIGLREGRPSSTLGHPVIFGGALAIVLPFTVTFALDRRSRAARRAWGAMTLVQGLALMLTLARGPWVAAACGLAILTALALVRRRALRPRLTVLAAAGTLAILAALAVSSTRRGVVGRASSFAHLGRDSSMSYRLHFGRAADAMLRDHPWLGVGWENFGLLYPRYRSAPSESISADLAPTMVHSGPLQTAVSGGLPALALQILFFGAVGATVIPRRGAGLDGHRRLTGAAFIASAAAYFVQNLFGWPHVALEPLAFSTWGLGVAWSLSGRDRAAVGTRWSLPLLAAAVAAGGLWMSLWTWRSIRAERLMFDAQRLDLRRSWDSIDGKLRAALELSPDRAWVSDTAAQVYMRRAATGDRSAYERGVALTKAAWAANPFDPYVRLRRAELDSVAIDHGLIPAVTAEGRAALAAAKSMSTGSNLVRRVETSLSRSARGPRIAWIEPQATAGFGPAGSLIVAGLSPQAPAGTRIFLHWRNVTRGTPWATAEALAPDAEGRWFHAIPDASPSDAFEAYATSESRAHGPCVYPGRESIQTCSPLSLIEPTPAGAGPPGSLLVAGSAPADGTPIVLHWRNDTRRSAWVQRPLRSAAAADGASFPPDAPGNWYSVIQGPATAEQYQAYLSTPSARTESCTYMGDQSPALCAPVSWIQPRVTAGFGPAGSLVVAGLAPKAWAGAPVFLHWRNASRRSAWTTETYAPVPDPRGNWYNYIPNASLTDRYEVYVTAPTAESGRCTYTGDGLRNLCP